MKPAFPALLRTSAFTLIGGAAAFATLTYAAVTPDNATDEAAASPTAYVYVNESNPAGTVTQTEGFAVAANGALSSLPGSPYSAVTEGSIGVSGNYLFLSDGSNGSVVTYAIGSDGALTQQTSTNVGAYPVGTGSEGPLTLSFDRTGRSLYDLYAENDAYQAFNIKSNGGLSYMDYATAQGESSSGLSFTANDKFAYESGCYHGSPTIDGYTRGPKGALTLTYDPELPPQPSGAQYSYCPWGSAVSGNGYLVVAEIQDNDMAHFGPTQMVTFEINPTDGSLSTKDTVKSAPDANVGNDVSDYAFDATGSWLAVGGLKGITIFSFTNGVLKQTGSYAFSEAVAQLAWDSTGHLVVYTSAYGMPQNLYVLNISGGKPKLAPGSPVALQYGGR